MWNPFKKKEGVLFGSQASLGRNDYGEEISPGEIERPAEFLDSQEFTNCEEKETTILADDKWTLGLKKTARIILLALAVLTPLFFLPVTTPGDILTLSKRALLITASSAVLLIWFATIVKQQGTFFKRSGIEYGILTWTAGWLLASIFSPMIFKGFVSTGGFISMANMGLLFLLYSNYFEKGEIFRAVNYLILGLFLTVALALLNLFSVPVFDWIKFAAPGGITVSNQFNSIGSLSVVGAIASIALVLAFSQSVSGLTLKKMSGESEKRKWFWPAIRTATILVSLFAVLLLNWRTFYLVIVVGMIVLSVTPAIAARNFGFRRKLSVLQIIGPLVLAVMVIVILALGRFIIIDLPGRQLVPTEVSLSRSVSYSIAKEVLLKRTAFGVGPDNFQIAYDLYRPRDINESNFWNIRFASSFSELTNIATVGGAAGLLAFFTLLFFIVKPIIFGKLKNGDDFRVVDFWTIFPGLVSGLVLFGLYPFNISLYFVLFVLIGLTGAVFNREDKKMILTPTSMSPTSVATSLIFTLVLVAAIIGGYLVFQKYRAEIAYAKAFRLELDKEENFNQASNLLIQAVNYGRDDSKYISGLSQLLVSEINREIGKKSDNQASRDKIQTLVRSVVQLGQKLTVDFAGDSSSWATAGEIYQSLGDIVQGSQGAAIGALQESSKRNPQDPGAYFKVGIIHLNVAEINVQFLTLAKRQGSAVSNEKETIDLISKEYAAAGENFKKALELKSNYTAATYYLGIVYERQNKIKEAIKQIETTVVTNPQNPSLAFELGLLYYRDGQKTKAINEIARAVSLFKDYSNARWYLALMLEERGMLDEAIAQLQEILKLEVNKDNKIVIDKITALEVGKREIPPVKVTNKVPLRE